MRRAPSLTAHVVDAPHALRPHLFKWLAAFCVLDCVGAATSPATCTLGPNLACTKNFENVPVNRCGTTPVSLEMRYTTPCFALSFAQPPRGPTRNPTLILVLTYPVRRSEMEKAVACPPWWLTVLLGAHSSSQVAHGDIDVGGQPHPDLTETQKGSAELSWDSTPSPSRQLGSNPVVWMGTPDDFEGVTVDGLLGPSPLLSQPVCQKELPFQAKCKQLGANRNNCHTYFYEGKDRPDRPDNWEQCAWQWSNSKGISECGPRGFICVPNTANCNCPSRCPWEVQPDRCGEHGADKDTCADYFYEKQNGERRQCIWKKSSEGGALGCSAGGFKCVIKNEGTTNCKCEATCPQQLPFVKEAVGSNCKFQNANSGDCTRCP